MEWRILTPATIFRCCRLVTQHHPGKPVPRGFLQLIAGTSDGLKVTGSGRREIAELIASPTNPLTARVMVNRIWLHLFGRGIVPTADNFGVYGERPSNQELLDYLALRFMREGWSIKKQIRFLVLSQTFQQSSEPSPESLTLDPQDRLLSSLSDPPPRRRIDSRCDSCSLWPPGSNDVRPEYSALPGRAQGLS